MLQSLVQKVADSPQASDFFRACLEGGFRKLKERIASFTDNGRHLTLDCGCGTGIFAPLFPATNYVGIDLSEPNLTAARMRCPQHRFIKMDACSLRFESNSFDRIFFIGVLHHLCDEDLEKVFREASRVLKPSGQFLVVEDIPTRNVLNVVGRAVHSLDLGSNIRTSDTYRRILERDFHVRFETELTSGFMDYASFFCSPNTHSKSFSGNSFNRVDVKKAEPFTSKSPMISSENRS